MKLVFSSYYQNIAFRNTVLSQKFQASFFLSMISCYNFAIRNKLQKSTEIQHLIYTAGVWPTYLFVAASITLFQCLWMVHKTGTNLRNDEIWRLLLLEQIPTLGELDKISIMSNRWKRNKFTWYLLQQGIDLR